MRLYGHTRRFFLEVLQSFVGEIMMIADDYEADDGDGEEDAA